jgi:hypothetical protein
VLGAGDQRLRPSHLAAQPAGCFAKGIAPMDQTTLLLGEECQNQGAARGLAMNSQCRRRVYRDRPVRARERKERPYAHAVVYHEAVGILLAHPPP